MRKVLIWGWMVIAGCSMNKFVADHSPPIMDDQKKAFYAETSVKHAFYAGPALLKLVDGLILSSPENQELLLRGAELYCGFAMLLVEDRDRDWAGQLYLRGYHYAVRALGLEMPKARGASQMPLEKLESVLSQADKKLVPALFWSGMCLGGYIHTGIDDPEAVAEIGRMLVFARVALKLDETFFFAGPHLILGVYYGRVGESLGGNNQKCESHFRRVFEITHRQFPLAKVLYAKTCLVQRQDREKFENILNEVSELEVEDGDPMALIVAASREKARGLLDREDDLFP